MPFRSSLRALGAVTAVLGVALPVAATPPRPPVTLEVRLVPGGVDWELHAETDLLVQDASWRTLPAQRIAPPALAGLWVASGESRHGHTACATPLEWIELRLRIRDASGEMELGAAARRRGAPDAPLRRVALRAKPTRTLGEIQARFLYEAPLVDAGGYTGASQTLPLREMQAELWRDSTATPLAVSRLDATGFVRLALPAGYQGPVFIRLLSWIRTDPHVRLSVLEPDGVGPGALENARPHAIETPSVEVTAEGADLGVFVGRDENGRGRIQAFHILDVALDAWDALGSPEFLGHPPEVADSLLLLWGPDVRLRSTSYGGGIIEITSPGIGDTDGWSDGILLHEIGHHVAARWLYDASVGGVHLLGDVEQDVRLAFSEGLATAFSCWVRAHRAATRRNQAGAPIDAHPALFANLGLPPPDGIPGSLQYAWDVDANTLFGLPLERDGSGSESNIAAVLWDASDGADTIGAPPSDDDPTALGIAPLFGAARAMRGLPEAQGGTFEDYWRAWIATANDPGGAALAPLLREARIEFAADADEPDDTAPRSLAAWSGSEASGGVVLSEFVIGQRTAVEIANRSNEPVELGGWALVARTNSSTGNPALTYTLPPFVLAPRARLVVRRGGQPRDNGPRDLFPAVWTVPWFPRFEGACSLLDAAGRGVDFVRWSAHDGTPSTTPPPPGVGWTQEARSPDFGQALARRDDLPDADSGAEFIAATPTLGMPNTTVSEHRSLFAERDVDRWIVRADAPGVYTFATRKLRSNAVPRVELFAADAARPLLVAPRIAATTGESRFSVWLDRDETFEVRAAQNVGEKTRFGSYDVVWAREPDARLPLPPVAVHADVDVQGNFAALRLGWLAAGAYDSLSVRVGSAPWTSLPGTARSWEVALPQGRYVVQLAAHVLGVDAPTPALVVAAEPWPGTLSEPFDSLAVHDWQRTGEWATTTLPGRAGRVLASTLRDLYPDNLRSSVRFQGAVRLAPGARLRFQHACIVRLDDTARLELSTDWGATWEVLARYDWTQHRGRGEAANWRDGHADAADWVQESVDLSRWEGLPAQVRFVMESDFVAAAAGWFIDDLEITGPPPGVVRLDPAFPNPFNPSTTLRFTLPQPSDVTLRILDVRGRLVRLVVSGPYPEGTHQVPWNGIDGHGERVASGIYFAELRAGPESRTTKLCVLR